MEEIDFEKLLGVESVEELDDRLCEKNVCGGKVMCFFSRDKKSIFKEMRESFNFGIDCLVVDECKDIFGIKKIGMKRVISNKEVDYNFELNNNEVEKLYNINLNRKKIEIDDYCVDIHVCEGRLKGKNEKDFVLEGSVIVNENMEILNEIYKEVYNYRKMN